MENQPNNPLHGVKLADILAELVDNYGWEHMAFKVNINCFKIAINPDNGLASCSLKL